MSQFQFGNFENRRGGSLFFKNVPISIWEFWKQREGLYFSKMSQFQLFDSVFCNITFIRNVWNYKCPNLVRGGGGQHFSKMSEIQKCPKGRRGGEGSTLFGTLSQIFSIFYFDASPKLHLVILKFVSKAIAFCTFISCGSNFYTITFVQ